MVSYWLVPLSVHLFFCNCIQQFQKKWNNGGLCIDKQEHEFYNCTNESIRQVNRVGTYVEFYCRDYNKELKKLVDPMIRKKFGWLAQKDYDDFYSAAAQAVWECEMTFDPQKQVSFLQYLIPCIERRFKNQVTYMNRKKRMRTDERGNYLYDLSFDAPTGEDGVAVQERVRCAFDMEEVMEQKETWQNGRLAAYMNGLSRLQKEIVKRKLIGMRGPEIKEQLNLGDRQYKQQCRELTSFANVRLLYAQEQNEEEREEDKMTQTQTMENCKTDKITIASMIKKIEKRTIRFDHPLQRESEQWTPAMKGNLISDILQGNRLHPLVFAEQIIHGAAVIWDLDGKQRCTNAYLFSKNSYPISRNIRRWMIRYPVLQKDKDGRDLLDENGYPIVAAEEFDIRGKRFSELPEELQDRFLDYSFNYDQYLNCSEEDIGYHIERYNDGKPMTAPQKGLTKLGTQYAELVKSISVLPFFKNTGSYKASEFKNGTIQRVVVESVMTAKFLDSWKKNQEDMCRFLKEEASVSDFEALKEMVIRLDAVVTEETAALFDSKDSFLWFGLFASFLDLGLPDDAFISFLAEFAETLHKRPVDGMTYDALCIDQKTGKVKATKDRSVVAGKMNLLKKLMREYFLE